MGEIFFGMVKNWTVSDYCTPGIKAEIIFDMLISEFVEDLVRYYYFGSKNSDVEVTLLTKEFPIQTNETNNLNAKVDYLVSVGAQKLVLVELKTTNDSFSKDQKDRMEEAVNSGAKKLMGFYYGIVSLKSGNKLDHRKYKYAFEEMFCENLRKAKLDKKTIEAVPDLDYLYISLTDSHKLPEKKLILTECCVDKGFISMLKGQGRRQLWGYVSEIILECAGKLEVMKK